MRCDSSAKVLLFVFAFASSLRNDVNILTNLDFHSFPRPEFDNKPYTPSEHCAKQTSKAGLVSLICFDLQD